MTIRHDIWLDLTAVTDGRELLSTARRPVLGFWKTWSDNECAQVLRHYAVTTTLPEQMIVAWSNVSAEDAYSELIRAVLRRTVQFCDGTKLNSDNYLDERPSQRHNKFLGGLQSGSTMISIFDLSTKCVTSALESKFNPGVQAHDLSRANGRIYPQAR